MAVWANNAVAVMALIAGKIFSLIIHAQNLNWVANIRVWNAAIVIRSSVIAEYQKNVMPVIKEMIGTKGSMEKNARIATPWRDGAVKASIIIKIPIIN
jgi:hypothetical protein